MTEFGIFLGVALAALTVTAYQSRSLTKKKTTRSSLAFPRTIPRSFVHLHTRALSVAAILVSFLLFVAFALVRTPSASDPAKSPYVLASWLTASFLVGTAISILALRIAALVSFAHIPHVAASTRSSVQDAVRVSVRSAAVSTISILAAGLLGVGSMFSFAFASLGGFKPGLSLHAASAAPLLVVSYSLGCSAGSLFASLLGNTFVTASVLVSDSSLDSSDPSLVAASSLEFPVSTSMDVFNSVTAGLALAMVALAGLRLGAPTQGSAFIMLPLLCSSFGLLASIVGGFVIRTDRSEPVLRAIHRGFAVTIILCSASFLGLSRWLFGGQWLYPWIACTSGLAGVVVCLLLDRNDPSPMIQNPTERQAPALRQAHSEMARSAVLLLTAGAVLAAGFCTGIAMGSEQTGYFGVVLACIGLLVPAPFILLSGAFASALRFGLKACECSSDPLLCSGAMRLVTAGHHSAATARRYASIATMAVGTLALMALFQLVRSYGRLDGDMCSQPSAVAAAVTAVLGSAAGLFFLSECLRASTSAAARPSASHDQAEPADTPDELRSRWWASFLGETSRKGVSLAVAALAIPVLVGWLARFVGTRTTNSLAVAATGALLVGLIITGAAFPKGIAPIPTFGDGSKRRLDASDANTTVDETGKRAKNLAYGAVVVSDSWSTPFNQLAGSSLHAFIKLLATALVALAPLFY